MIDLTVAGTHNYYVAAGGSPVLVHNSSCREYFAFTEDGAVGIGADVDADGALNTAITAVGGRLPTGSQLFADAMEALRPNVTSVRGNWHAGSGTTRDNLDSFNAGIQIGLSVEEAALNTFTGKMAARYGFNHVVVEKIEGPLGECVDVVVRFVP